MKRLVHNGLMVRFDTEIFKSLAPHERDFLERQSLSFVYRASWCEEKVLPWWKCSKFFNSSNEEKYACLWSPRIRASKAPIICLYNLLVLNLQHCPNEWCSPSQKNSQCLDCAWYTIQYPKLYKKRKKKAAILAIKIWTRLLINLFFKMWKTSTLASCAFWQNELAVIIQNRALGTKNSVLSYQEFWNPQCWESASVLRKSSYFGHNKSQF